MLDPITSATLQITKLLSSGIAERELMLRAVVRRFPDMTTGELSQALQGARAEAERKAARSH
jgi:hypothetical protein